MENSNYNSQPVAGTVGNPSSGVTSSEDVDEGQDEEPSSSRRFSHAEKELEDFRRQWKMEIECFPNSEKVESKRRVPSVIARSGDKAATIEENARQLFLCGVRAESAGKLQDAISFYRKAIQLVPDIEFRIDDSISDYEDEFSEPSDDDSTGEENSSESDNELDNLSNKFQKLAARCGTSKICNQKHDQNAIHISSLPPEVFLYILKWVVSQDLDVFSLEQVSKVCRGFYICARDPELWRLVCLRLWDVNVDTPNRYGSWRNMFIQRPHVFFNGVYISKTTYVRYGESSFQDTNYRPCYLVEYYRYLRFFPDSIVLMLTTADDPYQSLYKLRHRKTKHQTVLYGHYKLIGATVMAVINKPASGAVPSASNYYRFRRQRQMQETQGQTFHIELEVKSVKKRLNCQLSWNRYSIHTVYRNGQETVSNFDLVPSNFPSFWFSRVKSFAAETESPLQ